MNERVSAAEYRARLSRPVVQARQRALPRGAMNKTEQRYAQELDDRMRRGELLGYRFECVTFLLAHDVRYTPDFELRLPDGLLEYHDVKGTKRGKSESGEAFEKPWIEEDARIKIRVAAHEMPWHRFCVVFERRGGIWSAVEVHP